MTTATSEIKTTNVVTELKTKGTTIPLPSSSAAVEVSKIESGECCKKAEPEKCEFRGMTITNNYAW